ncbi:hypothetical protein [Christensenella intestinihominis]|uniref:hypothetical protein n=1 Tax=Christensenella intestinihominis TaxID=1851429 RepID=UPI0008324804|nr:hypothetical protein [Christensenella intestinihominis]
MVTKNHNRSLEKVRNEIGQFHEYLRTKHLLNDCFQGHINKLNIALINLTIFLNSSKATSDGRPRRSFAIDLFKDIPYGILIILFDLKNMDLLNDDTWRRLKRFYANVDQTFCELFPQH